MNLSLWLISALLVPLLATVWCVAEEQSTSTTTTTTTVTTTTTTTTEITTTTITTTAVITTTTQRPTTTTVAEVYNPELVNNLANALNDTANINVESVKTVLEDVGRNIALILVQSGNSNSSNGSSSSAALDGFNVVVNLVSNIASLGTTEACTTALSIVSIIFDVSSTTIAGAGNSNNVNGNSVGALASNVVNIILVIAQSAPYDSGTGSVTIVVGNIKISKKLMRFMGFLRNEIGVNDESAKRATNELYLGGINLSVLEAYANANPDATPELQVSSAGTPDMFVVQDGLSVTTTIACPLQYLSNQIVSVATDNVTEYYLRPANGYLTYVKFYQENVRDAACNFSEISYSCGRWDTTVNIWTFTDCKYTYENSTHVCYCTRFGTFGIFVNTYKSASDSLNELETLAISDSTDFSSVASTVTTVFADLDAYYTTYTGNLTYVVTIVDRVLALFDDIANLSSISTTSLTSVITVFNLILNKDATFFTKLNQETNLATKMFTKIENVFKVVDISNNFETSGTGFTVYGTKPSAMSLYGFLGDGSSVTPAIEGNATEPAETAKFGAFFNEAAISAASPNLRIFFILFDNTATIVQSIISSGSNCNNQILSPKLIVAKASEELTPVGDSLFTSYYYQNESITEGDCALYTTFEWNCVFFDTTTNSLSKSGCTHSYADGRHKCSCNHLTAFTFTASAASTSSAKTWYQKAEISSTVIGAGIFIICVIFAIVILLFDRCSSVVATSATTQSSYQFYGLFLTLLVNLVIFNVFYIVFGFLNFSINNTNLCEAIGILLHYFFITTFGLIMLMTILRFFQIYLVMKSSAKFTIISSIVLYFIAAIIVMIAIVVPAQLVKYISETNRCWLHDAHLGFAIAPTGVEFLVAFVFIVLTFLQLKFNLLRKQETYKPNSFDFFAISTACLILASLTWFFAFMVMYPSPASQPHLNFVFALVYCVLNIAFGIFLLLTALLLAKKNSSPNRVTSSPKVKLVESVLSVNRPAMRVDSHGAQRISARKITLTPIE